MGKTLIITLLLIVSGLGYCDTIQVLSPVVIEGDNILVCVEPISGSNLCEYYTTTRVITPSVVTMDDFVKNHGFTTIVKKRYVIAPPKTYFILDVK